MEHLFKKLHFSAKKIVQNLSNESLSTIRHNKKDSDKDPALENKLIGNSANAGFTLIELLLVMVIIVIMSASSFAVMNRFNRTQSLGIYYEDMKTDLNFAKSSAFSQVVKKCKNDTGDSADKWILQGYRFSYTPGGNSYTIAEVCNKPISNPINVIKTVTFPEGWSISSTVNNDPILFKTLSGGTEGFGGASKEIILNSDRGSKRVRVYKSGVIEGVND